MTEAERYEKTIYKGPKKNDTKGRKMTPQESWMETIADAMENCPPALSSYLQTLSSYDNVPRKEKAFRNFSANSLNLRGKHGDETISSIWKHLSSLREAKMKQQEEAKKAEQKATEEKKVEEKAEKKIEEPKKTNESKSSSKEGKKSTKKVVKAMKKALKKAPSKQMKMKELRKIIEKKLDDELKNMSKDDIKKMMKLAIEEETSIALDNKVVKIVQ